MPGGASAALSAGSRKAAPGRPCAVPEGRSPVRALANLQDYLIGKTIFVITHRIFTSGTFDKIIILDHGSIAEQGTHDELMALNGRYAKLYRHQTS